MEKIWLATKYYLDDKLAGCSAATERLFTRLIAWCGDNETPGILPSRPHIMVGLPRALPQLRDLVSRGVLVPIYADSVQEPQQHLCRNRNNICAESVAEKCADCVTGSAQDFVTGYRLNGWGNWNPQADELARRKKSDRDRKRRQRERQGDSSRDMSRDVTRTDKDKDYIEDRTRDIASHVSNASASENERPTGPPIQRDAARLVRDIVPNEHPSTVKTALRLKASELIHGGTEPDVVAEALTRWVGKSGIGPGVLPSLVSDVVKERSGVTTVGARAAPRSTTDDRVAQAQALKRPDTAAAPALLEPRRALE